MLAPVRPGGAEGLAASRAPVVRAGGGLGALAARATHGLAIATAAATFLLILIGGLVHGTGSSLACPDWPTCYGTMLPKMEGGVAVEHSHRLAAGAVVVLTLALAIVLTLAR